MRHIFYLSVALVMATAGLVAQPQVIIGPGLNSGRTIYHQNFNRTLSNDTTYILTGLYAIDSTYLMTIEPGTVIMGDTAACLIISRGAKIYANGTVADPIVFTSPKPVGQRSGGDWGGIVILGAAPSNQANPLIEGGILPGTYGGGGAGQGNPEDSSGVFRYVRIEFPGYRFQLNNEVNGLTMGGVGRKTIVEYVQVAYSYDDGFEWFGGTVNARHLVAIGGIDDEFDTDFGFQGNIQFAFGMKDPNVFEFVGGQTNGFESDNEGSASYTSPRTRPRLSNVTLVGPLRTDAITPPPGHRFEYVSVTRRGSQLSLYNSILMGYPGGYSLRDLQSKTSAQGDTLQVRNLSLQASGPLPVVHSTGTDPSGFVAADWFNTLAYANTGGSATRLPSAIGLTNMTNLNDPDPRPLPGSEPTTAGVEFTNLNALAGGWFVPTTYRGAFDPSLPMNQQWTAGWTNFDPQNTSYVTSVSEVGGNVPDRFVLGQNYPNPFNPSTVIELSVPTTGEVTLLIFNILGEQVATLVDQELNPGNYRAEFGGSSLSSGTYIYRLSSNGYTEIRKMVLMK
ncbi:MAG: T9SS type A sorting domain-containing protein [Bacteroidota bacterium]